MNLTPTELISLIIGLGGLLTGWITTITNKKKTQAEVQDIVADTYGDIIVMLREQGKINAQQITALMEKDLENQRQITEYQKEIVRYRISDKELTKRVKELESQIEKLNTYNENIDKTTV